MAAPGNPVLLQSVPGLTEHENTDRVFNYQVFLDHVVRRASRRTRPDHNPSDLVPPGRVFFHRACAGAIQENALAIFSKENFLDRYF